MNKYKLVVKPFCFKKCLAHDSRITYDNLSSYHNNVSTFQCLIINFQTSHFLSTNYVSKCTSIYFLPPPPQTPL